MNTILAQILDWSEAATVGLSDQDKAKLFAQLATEFYARSLAQHPVHVEQVSAHEVIGPGEYYDPLIRLMWDELEVVADEGVLCEIVETVNQMLNKDTKPEADQWDKVLDDFYDPLTYLLNKYWKIQPTEAQACILVEAVRGMCREGNAHLRPLLKEVATNFFYHWYNSPGNNTGQGYDEWLKNEGSKYEC